MNTCNKNVTSRSTNLKQNSSETWQPSGSGAVQGALPLFIEGVNISPLVDQEYPRPLHPTHSCTVQESVASAIFCSLWEGRENGLALLLFICNETRPHEAQSFLGSLYRLASINVGPPHPTLIWSQPGFEPTT